MSSAEISAEATRRPFTGRRVRFGDVVLQVVAGAAALGVTVLVGLIIWKVVERAWPAIEKYGLAFVTRVAWNPVVGQEIFGAGSFLFGTVITSLVALLLAAPLAMGIALFLTELAPSSLRGPVTALVETLAAIPSVVLGLWGILVLGPVLRDHGRALAAQRARLHPALRRAVVVRREHLHRDRRPDDHDPADRLEHQPRAVPRRAARAEGRRARARHDALGDGARRHVPVRARRHRRRADPRPRSRDRRGDRRHAGDRRRRLHSVELFAGGDTLASKIAAAYQGAPSKLETGVADLPRRDPARLLAAREPRSRSGSSAARPGSTASRAGATRERAGSRPSPTWAATTSPAGAGQPLDGGARLDRRGDRGRHPRRRHLLGRAARCPRSTST